MNNLDSKTQAGADRLENYGIYQIACELFDRFWADSEIMLTRIIGGLAKTIRTIETRRTTEHISPPVTPIVTCHAPLVTFPHHPSPIE